MELTQSIPRIKQSSRKPSAPPVPNPGSSQQFAPSAPAGADLDQAHAPSAPDFSLISTGAPIGGHGGIGESGRRSLGTQLLSPGFAEGTKTALARVDGQTQE